MTEVLVATYFVVVLFSIDGAPPQESYRASVDGPKQCGEVIGLIAEDIAIEGEAEVRIMATCVMDMKLVKQPAI